MVIIMHFYHAGLGLIWYLEKCTDMLLTFKAPIQALITVTYIETP